MFERPLRGHRSWSRRAAAHTALAIALLWLASFVRLHELGARSLWMDEAFSVHGSILPIAEALRFLLADGVHPPLYYFVQRLAYLFGEGEWSLRWPAAMFGVLGVAAIVRLGRDWFPQRSGMLAGLLLALSPFAVWYSREARMYSLLALLTVGAMWSFARLLSFPAGGAGRGWRVAQFTIVSAALYLTHYFGLFAPLVQFAHLLLTFRRNHLHLRPWLAAQVVAALPFGLWVIALYRREGWYFGIGWIHPPRWDDPLLTLQNFVAGYGPEVWRWAATLGFACFAILGLWAVRRLVPDRATLLGLWLFLPPLVTFALSWRRPTYVDRFLIGSLPALVLAAAAGASALTRLRLRPLMFPAMLLMAAASAYAMWLSFDWTAPEYAREDWRGVAEYIRASERPGDALLLRSLHYVLPLGYYYRGALEAVGMDAGWEANSPADGPSAPSRLWLVYRGQLEDSHRFAESLASDFERHEKDPEFREWLEAMELFQVERRDFPGVAVFLYDLSSLSEADGGPR